MLEIVILPSFSIFKYYNFVRVCSSDILFYVHYARYALLLHLCSVPRRTFQRRRRRRRWNVRRGIVSTPEGRPLRPKDLTLNLGLLIGLNFRLFGPQAHKPVSLQTFFCKRPVALLSPVPRPRVCRCPNARYRSTPLLHVNVARDRERERERERESVREFLCQIIWTWT